ncbi:DUF6765 family protein [Poseidonibacter lekithochrous]|uniref:DUF6765 family protein n=1 Tax=Poseidonibacter lekithochrous TaxID=1904463 RepID=UPI0008FC363E|nr:DUF6765 family protein [Poseidonibacter lekithochrous]QKJ23819.1 hypothetical protein ALEK_2574 [Poseidonibacter lekithochrous]
MQIDGHHTLTYTLSRMVGFTHEEANTVAYSAQYVDDATNAGIINFTNGATFSRISSAHTMTAYDLKYYTDAHENNLVWVPFHFLPGNDTQPSDAVVEGSFVKKLVCRPYSDVAVDMLDACMLDKDKSYALHRLGITIHVFADTFAHQGFAGKLHKINEVNDLECHNYTFGFWDKATATTLNTTFPMGHGAALSCPDMPFLEWSYTDGLGERINRDNLDIFMKACYDLYGQLGRYLSEIGRDVKDIIQEDFDKIKDNFISFKEEDGEKRHKMWLDSINKGDFSFGSVELEYIAKGIGSWKYDAIKQDKETDDKDDRFEFTEEFMNSDWRKFHVALKAHRFDVINDILPRYGISVS